MKNIKDVDVQGKRVLLRVDFNVSLDKEGKISDNLRIRESLPTINYLLQNKAKVIIISHFAEPEEKRTIKERNKEVKKENSLSTVAVEFASFLNKKVDFVADCIGEEVTEAVGKMKEGEVVMLENLRVYQEEKENSEEFGRELSSLGDIYINDAFSVSHRNHASIVQPPLNIPSFSGMLMEREVRVLKKIKRNPQKPVVAVIGGAKVKSKIATVNYFLENADHVLLGGKIANALLVVNNIAHNQPFPEKEVVESVKNMDYTTSKLHLPVDVIVSTNDSGDCGVRETAVGSVKEEEDIFDIGSETVKLYGDILKEAGTVIWAGPLGLSEKKAFEKGTKEVGAHIANNKEALKVAGGGDTNRALKKFNLLKEMDHVSCGGGAMLTYIMNGPMPGIEALNR